MMKYVISVVVLFVGLSSFADAGLDSSAKEIRAILDVPNLAELLGTNGSIVKIEKVDIKANVYVVDDGFCKAKIKVILDSTGVSSPKAEALGAECGP